MWLSEDIEETWLCRAQRGKRGHPKQYSDAAIEQWLTMEHLYKLPYCSAQGFVESLLFLTGFTLTSPCYSQMSGRSRKLLIKLKRIAANKGNLDIVVDSQLG